MTVQFSTELRNARLDQIETIAAAGAILKLKTGAQPANCAAADSGTVIKSYTLSADWAAAAGSGTKAFNDLPLSGAATGAGDLGHYRLYKSNGTTCVMQGSITITGGGGDLTVDNVSVEVDQTVNVTAWTITDGNA